MLIGDTSMYYLLTQCQTIIKYLFYKYSNTTNKAGNLTPAKLNILALHYVWL